MQLSIVCRLLILSLDPGSYYHTVSWTSRKYKPPVKSVAVGKILAAGEGRDEENMLKRSYVLLHRLKIELLVLLEAKDFYTALSTQRQFVNRSVGADANYILYQFGIGNADGTCWIPDRLCLADSGIKTDSLLTKALQLLLFIGAKFSKFQNLKLLSQRKTAWLMDAHIEYEKKSSINDNNCSSKALFSNDSSYYVARCDINRSHNCKQLCLRIVG